MTTQPHNRFVFCVVVVEIAVNGGSMSTISHQNTFSQKSWLLVVLKVELSIICKGNMIVSLKNTLILKTAI